MRYRIKREQISGFTNCSSQMLISEHAQLFVLLVCKIYHSQQLGQLSNRGKGRKLAI